jgi:RNA polymerase sigma-70 factor (ECF subfamily)
MSMTDDEQTATPNEAIGVLLANRARFVDFLERRVGSRDLAEDILQDSMAKAVERSGQLRDDESIMAWFYRVLRNAVTDLHRRRGAANRALEQLAREVEASSDHDEVAREVCHCVSGVLDTLKPEYQAPIQAIELDGRDVRGFAADAGITTTNASVRLHRARKTLAERLKKMCGACAEHGCLDCTCRSSA